MTAEPEELRLRLTDAELVTIWLMAYRANQERVVNEGQVIPDPDLTLLQPELQKAAFYLMCRVGSELAFRNIDPMSVNLGGTQL